MLNLYQRYIEEDGTQPVPDDHTTNSDILQKVMRKQIGGYLVTLVLTFFTVGIFAVFGWHRMCTGRQYFAKADTSPF
jgi:hypothetical protein